MATKEVTKTITVVLKGLNKSDGKKKDKDLELARELTNKGFDFVIDNSKRYFERYTTLHEDYLAKNGYDIVEKTLRQGKSLYNSFNMGKQIAKKYDLKGSKKGMIMFGSATGFLLNAYMQNQSRLSGMYQQLNATNMQTGLDASRAGLINGGRGTEN